MDPCELLTDQAAINAFDSNNCTARYGIAALGPMAVTLLAWVLDTNKHCFSIWAPSQAGDFTLFRAYQEAVYLSGLRVAHQHLIITHTCKTALV